MGSAGRGALIVFEGCDRAGKSTQCKKLVQSLLDKNIKAKLMSFPDRSTPTGKIISNYLSKKEDLPDKSIHLLFSANRWEFESEMTSALISGTTLIVDRYSFSGVAFSSAKKGMDLEWCWKPEIGLPKPDRVLFLNLSPEAMARRGGFGDERYENTLFQQQVKKNFSLLQDSSWETINADQDIDTLHKELLNRTLEIIDESSNVPLKRLE